VHKYDVEIDPICGNPDPCCQFFAAYGLIGGSGAFSELIQQHVLDKQPIYSEFTKSSPCELLI
jgi:hypothetical protein